MVLTDCLMRKQLITKIPFFDFMTILRSLLVTCYCYVECSHKLIRFLEPEGFIVTGCSLFYFATPLCGFKKCKQNFNVYQHFKLNFCFLSKKFLNI